MVSAFIFLVLAPNIPILFAIIPQLIIINLIHCTGYTALLKTLHSYFQWDALPCCYDPHWLYNTFIFLGLWIYLNPWRLKIFSTNGVNGVQKRNTCVLDFSCHVCGLISLSSWLFLWFVIGWMVQISFLGHVVNSSFLNSLFPVNTFGLDLLSDTYLNKLLFLWCPETENSSVLRVFQVRCFFGHKGK